MRLWIWLKTDWGYKVLSVLLAALLWGFVLSEQNPVSVEQYSIELRANNVGSGLIPVDLPSQVRVKLRAPRELLARLRPDRVRAYVDAQGCEAGQHTLPIYVEPPPGVQIQEYEPAAVTVVLDEWVERTVEVEVRVVGIPQADYTYEPNPSLTPEQVKVRGPSRDVVQVWRAHGEVDVSGARGDVERRVLVWPLDLSGRQVDNVNLEPVEVVVRVPVSRRMMPRTVQIVPRVTGSLAQGFELGEISVLPGTASVLGTPEIMENLQHVNTQPVSVEGAAATFERETGLDLPPGVEILDSHPLKVQVRVEVKPTATRRPPAEIRPDERGGAATSAPADGENPTPEQEQRAPSAGDEEQ